MSLQSEGKTHKQALLEVSRSWSRGSFLCWEGEAEWCRLLLLLCSSSLYYSDGGPHRAQVGFIQYYCYLHFVIEIWFVWVYMFSNSFFLCLLLNRLFINYITFAVGEILLLILTSCSLAAILPGVSYKPISRGLILISLLSKLVSSSEKLWNSCSDSLHHQKHKVKSVNLIRIWKYKPTENIAVGLFIL